MARATHPTVADVFAELARGKIVEVAITHPSERVSGFCDQGTGVIAVNKYPIDLADTLVHELLHRLHTRWGERRIARETKYVLRRMTDEDVAHLCRAYRRRACKLRRTLKLAAT